MLTVQDNQEAYNEAYEAYLGDIYNEDKQHELEVAEKRFYEAFDFQCLADKLDQAEFLKALDFCDAV